MNHPINTLSLGAEPAEDLFYENWLAKNYFNGAIIGYYASKNHLSLYNPRVHRPQSRNLWRGDALYIGAISATVLRQSPLIIVIHA